MPPLGVKYLNYIFVIQLCNYYFAKQYSNNSLISGVARIFPLGGTESERSEWLMGYRKLLSQLATLMLMVRKIRMAIIRFGRDSIIPHLTSHCSRTRIVQFPQL